MRDDYFVDKRLDPAKEAPVASPGIALTRHPQHPMAAARGRIFDSVIDAIAGTPRHATAGALRRR